MFSRLITLGLLVFGVQGSVLPSTLEARNTIETCSVCPSADDYTFGGPDGSAWTIMCGTDVNPGTDLGEMAASNLFECQQGCTNFSEYCEGVSFVPGWNSGTGNWANCFFKGPLVNSTDNSGVESAVALPD